MAPDARILVYGSINIDLVAEVAAIPRPGETVLSAGYQRYFGGKGANQAVAAARASRGTGIAVAMAGRVGDDDFGRAAIANLTANGVDTRHVGVAAEPTGCAFIVVESEGENAITVASGANAAFAAAGLEGELRAGDIVVFQMEVPFGPALDLARRARERGAGVLWNIAPAPRGMASADLEALIRASDVVAVNEHEALAVASALGGTGQDAREAARSLARIGGGAVVLTAGARGAFAFRADGAGFEAPALPVQAVDTTGAGDCFVGVFAAAMAEGPGLERALRRATLAASLACRRPGAQSAAPDRAEIDAAEAAS